MEEGALVRCFRRLDLAKAIFREKLKVPIPKMASLHLHGKAE